MKKYSEKLIGLIKDKYNLALGVYKNSTKKQKIIASLVLVTAIVALAVLPKDEMVKVAESNKVANVKLYTVGGDSVYGESYSLIGSVTSVNEAVIRTESSGKLTKVYKKVGDKVVAGEIIAIFENQAERASVLSAEGAYESAKAAKNIFLASQGVTSLTNGSAINNLEEAKKSTVNLFSSIFVTVEDLILVKTDVVFSDARNNTRKIKVVVPDQALVSAIESMRAVVGDALVARSAQNNIINTSSDLVVQADQYVKDLDVFKKYFDSLASALAIAIPTESFSQSQIDAAKQQVNQARSVLAGSVSSVNGSKLALSNTSSASLVSDTVLKNKAVEVTANDASIKIALGGYNAALARLAKTIVRSPLTGTLNQMNLSTGDFVNQGQQVGIVSNNGSLEIVSYISPEDLDLYSVGREVLVENKVKGVITSVLGAIDPSTNKIEVRIGIPGVNSVLVNGQSVSIKLVAAEVQKNTRVDTKIVVPIGAVKMTPKGPKVYFVTAASSSLVSRDVLLGALLGDSVVVREGISFGDVIVVDVRGLKEGQIVEVIK